MGNSKQTKIENYFVPLTDKEIRMKNWFQNSERGFYSEEKLFSRGSFNAALLVKVQNAKSGVFKS